MVRRSVGQPTGICLDPATLIARIPVYLELEPDRVTLVRKSARLPMLSQMVKAGLRAKLVPQSLVTGQTLVELDISPDTPLILSARQTAMCRRIPAVQSDLQELSHQLSRAPVADTVVQALRTLKAVEKLADRSRRRGRSARRQCSCRAQQCWPCHG